MRFSVGFWGSRPLSSIRSISETITKRERPYGAILTNRILMKFKCLLKRSCWLKRIQENYQNLMHSKQKKSIPNTTELWTGKLGVQLLPLDSQKHFSRQIRNGFMETEAPHKGGKTI